MSHPVNYLESGPGGKGELALPLGFSTPPDRPHVGILTVLHRLLRGKYLWVFVFGATGAAIGAAGGYLSQKPLFRCEGQVQVSTPPIVLRETPENKPMADRQVNTQAALLSSDRTIAAAMNSDEWRGTGRGRAPEVEREFRESLQVFAGRDSAELIRVSFTDRDAKVARAAVDSVLNAYNEIWVKGALTSDEEFKVNRLDEERKSLDANIQNIQRQIEAIATEYGTDDLSILSEFHIGQQLKKEQAVAALREQLALREAGPSIPSPAPSDSESASAPSTLVPEQIAVLDPRMRELLKQRADIEAYITQLLETMTESHRSVKLAKNQLAAVDKSIEAEAKKFLDGRVVPDSTVSDQARTMSVDQLRQALESAERDLAAQRQTTILIGNNKLKLDELRRRKAQYQNDMLSIDERRKDLRIQSGNLGDAQQRIRIHNPVDTPSLPAVDRRTRMGAMGFVGGGMLPVGVIALIGFWQHKRKFTYSDEARERGPHATLLGILPHLPRDLSDPEQTAAAAHCVHQMRTLLQIGGDHRKVYAITSATAGDGKTSLALSLGMSFAASGARTLLIDFDMIGRGLSSALKLRPRQGLAAILEAGTFEPGVLETGIERLSVMPSGLEDERFVSRLARSMVHDLIEKARASYDVVVVDTGPILGSLEANFVSSEADGVVLVVGRGQQRSYVDRAFEQLHVLGARVAGMVFNRASTTDFMQSATSTSFRSVRDEPAPPVDLKSAPDFEPVARTVALDIRRHDRNNAA